MADSNITSRFEAALTSPKPADALYDLAKQLKAEGMSQQDMYDLYIGYFLKHRDDGDERFYDAIADNLDYIVGWCSPHSRLFETDLKTDYGSSIFCLSR